MERVFSHQQAPPKLKHQLITGALWKSFDFFGVSCFRFFFKLKDYNSKNWYNNWYTPIIIIILLLIINIIVIKIKITIIYSYHKNQQKTSGTICMIIDLTYYISHYIIPCYIPFLHPQTVHRSTQRLATPFLELYGLVVLPQQRGHRAARRVRKGEIQGTAAGLRGLGGSKWPIKNLPIFVVFWLGGGELWYFLGGVDCIGDWGFLFLLLILLLILYDWLLLLLLLRF